MVKVKSYRIGRRGLRGLVITVPRVWTEDVGIKPGDRLDVYRDTSDRLIIVATKRRRREVAAEATA